MMYYIQRKDRQYLETVDEFVTFREAKKMRIEYTIADPYARYYISTRACRKYRQNNNTTI
ncbi:MAG: hypothetical protein RLZZ171_1202 [Cyanobacteriota bacterium]|jgi:hypothetical protein